MTSPQKIKGNAWENTVARHLTELYGETFIRVPHSGAYIGGANQHRKQVLHEGQIRSFKGDIIPGESFPRFNCECKSYKDFPFHQLYSGDCKVLDGWIEQMMDVAEDGDMNILFMKFNRKGKFVVVQSNKTWVTDQFTYYTSKAHGDWLLIDFDHFFKHNKDLLKLYSSGSSDTKSTLVSDTQS